MLKYAHEFIKIRLIFHTSYLKQSPRPLFSISFLKQANHYLSAVKVLKKSIK